MGRARHREDRPQLRGDSRASVGGLSKEAPHEGLEQADAETHLQYANNDPSLALVLKEKDYATIVDQFKRQFGQYLSNNLDISKLCQSITKLDIVLIRRLIKMVISAYCYQYSGFQGQQATTNTINKSAAQAMIALLSQSERQLMTEENNLDIQLQLEDVLISVKQIINRSHH